MKYKRLITDAKTYRKKMSVLVNGLSSTSGTILQFGIFLIGAYLALTGHGLSAGSVLVFVQLLNFVINPTAVLFTSYKTLNAVYALVAGELSGYPGCFRLWTVQGSGQQRCHSLC